MHVSPSVETSDLLLWFFSNISLVETIPVNTVTSRRRHVHRQRVVIQFMTSGRRPADVSDWSIELTICATDRELRRHFGKPRAAGWRETDRQDSTGLASTGTSDDSQMCMHCQPAVTRRHASTGFAGLSWSTRVLAGCSKIGYISADIGVRKDNECYIHTWCTDDTIIQHKVICAVNLV